MSQPYYGITHEGGSSLLRLIADDPRFRHYSEDGDGGRRKRIMETAPDKQHAHELIERLPASQISTAVRFLEFMLLDPVARAVATAPPDDEPATGEDRRRFLEGQAWFRQRGKGVPMADVLAEFNLKPEDLGHPPDDVQ